MKILYYDPFSGISGDMNLGAMIDLGVNPNLFLEELSQLNLDGYEIRFEKDSRKGVFGTRAHIDLHKLHLAHGHSYDHIHRNLADIQSIINKSALNDHVKTISLMIFKELAIAEAKIHGTTVDQIHFHEVGAVDSIVDIVGAAICFDILKPDEVWCAPVQLGSGFVKCAHGTFPVPAPAVAELLKDKLVKTGAVPFETTTPTGAAILSVLTNKCTDKAAFKIIKTGYGIGGRDTDIPNVLRVILAETEEKSNDDKHNIIECNCDDLSPEITGALIEALLTAGADDAWLTPIIMKKSRPAVKISVLCKTGLKDKIQELLFKETTTFGMRSIEARKTELERNFSIVKTPYGEIKIKNAYFKGNFLKSKPEMEDCKKRAIENNISIREVMEAAVQAMKNEESKFLNSQEIK